MASEEARGPAVIIMARVPRPGEGKTRLRGVLSDAERARLQESFLRDAVEVALEANLGRVHIACTPPGAAPRVEEEFGGRVSTFTQQGEGLGERMLAALRRVEADGFAPLLMIGTDTPLLHPRRLREALAALADAGVCLGPSDDGGYYLLGCHEPLPALLDDVPWSTDRVLGTTLRLAAGAGIRARLLQTLYDIDTPADLERLRADLAEKDGKPGFRAPRHTAEVLR